MASFSNRLMMSSFDYAKKIVAITSFFPGFSLQRQEYECEIITEEEFEKHCLANECSHLFHDSVQYGLLIHHAEHYNDLYYFRPQFTIVNAHNNEGDEWSDTVIDSREKLLVEGEILKKELQTRAQDLAFNGVGQSHFILVCENMKVVISLGAGSEMYSRDNSKKYALSGSIFSFEVVPNQFAYRAIERKYKSSHIRTRTDSAGGEV